MKPAESAIVVPVPEAEPVVGPFRAKLDPAAALGVPVHVTVLYPFLARELVDDAVLASVREAIASVPEFEVTFARICWFDDEVVWLAPEPAAPFRALTSAVCDRFPGWLPYGGAYDEVVPHLTIGDRAPAAAMRAAAQAIEPRLPIHAGIRFAHLISNSAGSSPWRTAAEFPLGPGGRS